MNKDTSRYEKGYDQIRMVIRNDTDKYTYINMYMDTYRYVRKNTYKNTYEYENSIFVRI